ncbi:MAG TPA: hypothetical protein VM282_03975 [Acidimicrobiales bacterium]|nr:hypothetical protein [Acidimicrobiales bacterium]
MGADLPPGDVVGPCFGKGCYARPLDVMTPRSEATRCALLPPLAGHQLLEGRPIGQLLTSGEREHFVGGALA